MIDMITMNYYYLLFQLFGGLYWERFKKWAVCAWFHRKDHCHPEVWKEDNSYWHCEKCYPCSHELYRVGLYLKIKGFKE